MNTNISKKPMTPQRLLAREVATLLTHQPEENLQWKGTIIDLMEALHLAYTTFLIVDDDGVGLSYTRIVNQACQILHLAPPRNPYIVAKRGYNRKGARQLPFLTRYSYLLDHNTTQQPFMDKVGPM